MSSDEKKQFPMESAPPYDEVMNSPSLYPMAIQNHPSPVTQNATHPQMAPVMTSVVFNNSVNGGAVCQSCHAPLHTTVKYSSTCSTHLGFLCCCLVGLFFCAPCVYCMNSCREPRIHCVNCGARV